MKKKTKNKLKKNQTFPLQIVLFLIFSVLFFKAIFIPYAKRVYKQRAIEKAIEAKKEWKERATRILIAPQSELAKKYTKSILSEPSDNYILPSFSNMPKDFNTVLQTIKPGAMTRDEAMKAINDKVSKQLYIKSSGLETYNEKYDGVGIVIFNKNNEERTIGTFAFEYDKNEVIKKAYFRTMNEHLNVFISPADVIRVLGKADRIINSPSKYGETEYVYSSKGITFIGQDLGPWATEKGSIILSTRPIYSLILYEPCTYEDYVKDYTEMTPFFEMKIL